VPLAYQKTLPQEPSLS